jgi:uncharacterized protein YcgI (DUF1989 family)
MIYPPVEHFIPRFTAARYGVSANDMRTSAIPTGSKRIPPQSGTAFRIRAGETLVVVDVEGEQVADLVAFRDGDSAEYISSGRTIDYASTTRLTTGHVLYSNRSRPMFTIVRDDVGTHDFLLTPCSQQTFEIIYGLTAPHPSCLSNLATSLAEFGITEDAIPVSFNVFMNVEVAPDGGIQVLPPRSRAGDMVALRAEMDLIVGLTACSAELSNNYAFKPVDYAIVENVTR